MLGGKTVIYGDNIASCYGGKLFADLMISVDIVYDPAAAVEKHKHPFAGTEH